VLANLGDMTVRTDRVRRVRRRECLYARFHVAARLGREKPNLRQNNPTGNIPALWRTQSRNGPTLGPDSNEWPNLCAHVDRTGDAISAL
jgi:hypothetical protein